MRHPTTQDQNLADLLGDGDERERAEPGLLLVFSSGQPRCEVLALPGESLGLGRELLALGSDGPIPPDLRMSRSHARVTRTEQGLLVTDLRSRNGTRVDGTTLSPGDSAVLRHVLRMGDSVFIPTRDVRPFLRSRTQVHQGRVIGATLRESLERIAWVARTGKTLHIKGESGAGKEAAAQWFHLAGANARGPFIAVNCAAIPEGIAESLLFGARRGAFSGAVADSEGYLRAAHGGTLFLDEIADLHLAIQSKLLRALETKEVLAVGATQARPIEFNLCSAGHSDLRALVTSGHFREDLYFRIARPTVELPALRERREEVPYLVELALSSLGLPLSPSIALVEECLLRAWPGNVREFLAEIRLAAATARQQDAETIQPGHLSAAAGVPPSLGEPAVAPRAPGKPTKRMIEKALREQNGNVSRTARVLGLHRTQLRRLMTQTNVKR